MKELPDYLGFVGTFFALMELTDYSKSGITNWWVIMPLLVLMSTWALYASRQRRFPPNDPPDDE